MPGDMTTDEKLDKIQQDVAEIKESQARMEAVREQVDELRDTTYGNGRKGLKERMDAAEMNQATQLATCAAMRHLHTPLPWLRRAAQNITEKVAGYIVLAIILALFALWLESAAPKIVAGMRNTAPAATNP